MWTISEEDMNFDRENECSENGTSIDRGTDVPPPSEYDSDTPGARRNLRDQEIESALRDQDLIVASDEEGLERLAKLRKLGPTKAKSCSQMSAKECHYARIVDLCAAVYNEKSHDKIDNPDAHFGKISDWLTLDKANDIIAPTYQMNWFHKMTPVAMIFRETGSDVCHVGFKGTASAGDAIADIKAWSSQWLPYYIGYSNWKSNSHVHTGFLQYFQLLEPELKARLTAHGCYGPGKKVIFYGHSLGGAIAQLAGLWGTHNGMQVGLKTVAPPKAIKQGISGVRWHTRCSRTECTRHRYRVRFLWWSWWHYYTTCRCVASERYHTYIYGHRNTHYSMPLGSAFLRHVGDPVVCVPYDWMGYRHMAGTTASCEWRKNWHVKWWWWIPYYWFTWTYKCNNSTSLWEGTSCAWQWYVMRHLGKNYRQMFQCFDSNSCSYDNTWYGRHW
jgi:hypothetical protein